MGDDREWLALQCQRRAVVLSDGNEIQFLRALSVIRFRQTGDPTPQEVEHTRMQAFRAINWVRK